MKYLITFSTFAMFLITSCNNSKTTSETTIITDSVVSASATSTTWIVDNKASTLTWQGTKPTKVHEGTILIKEGSLAIENGKIIAGNFIIDMTTIAETSSSNDAKAQEKLTNHLKSSDFFNSDSFPVSTFAITKVQNDIVFGNLTIKNITREINFPINMKMDGAILNVTTGFAIDRTNWGINYNSGKKIKDKVANKIIGDSINYKLTLVAYKK